MGEGSTVLLVDDHPLVRRGLAALLALEPWVGRVVEAGTVRDGARTGVLEAVDVAVVDLGLPDADGVELVRLLRRSPGCPVLVLTMSRDGPVAGTMLDPASRSSVRECLEAGATGYVLKDTPPDAVVRAVRTVLDGGLVLGPNVTNPALLARPDRLSPPLDRLTPAELRLLTLVAQGRTNPAIARELGVVEKTVRNRVSTMLATLGVADRVQAALLARDTGLVAERG